MMKTWCEYCDPKRTIVYGFCGNCRRRCEPPLLDPKEMGLLDHEEFRRKWNQERSDLIIHQLRSMQRCHGQ